MLGLRAWIGAPLLAIVDFDVVVESHLFHPRKRRDGFLAKISNSVHCLGSNVGARTEHLPHEISQRWAGLLGQRRRHQSQITHVVKGINDGLPTSACQRVKKR